MDLVQVDRERLRRERQRARQVALVAQVHLVSGTDDRGGLAAPDHHGNLPGERQAEIGGSAIEIRRARLNDQDRL